MKRALLVVFIALGCQKTTAPAPPAETGPSTANATKPALPAFDDRCTTDAECGALHVYGSGPDACCSMGCAIGKGSKAWVDAVEIACKKTPHPECKDIVCDGPAPPFVPKCKDGRCTLTY